MLKKITNCPRSIMVLSVLVLCVVALTRCMNKEGEDGALKNYRGAAFAGSESCGSCHKDLYEKHLHTAHYLTTRPAAEQYIKGSFASDKNSYAFNRSVVVAMEKRADGLYQVEYFRGQQKRAERIDIVVGSGRKGQSFMYWSADHLFQLPITYFTAADAWSNSPGFPDKVVFNRVITSRCLECHSTFVQNTTPPDTRVETFDRQRIIYGVDCEKCHGPAADHVTFQREHPEIKTARYIINPGRLSRQQQLDLCASCHGGRLTRTTPSFEFTAGDTLSHFFEVDTTMPDPTQIDVHGNQYGLLRASKCFRNSMTMTCSSCHDAHTNEKGNVQVFSQRCMNCHSEAHGKICPLQKTIGPSITANCIDCHMPVQPSKAIAVQLTGDAAPVSAMIRSHYITIYPEETKKWKRKNNEHGTGN